MVLVCITIYRLPPTQKPWAQNSLSIFNVYKNICMYTVIRLKWNAQYMWEIEYILLERYYRYLQTIFKYLLKLFRYLDCKIRFFIFSYIKQTNDKLSTCYYTNSSNNNYSLRLLSKKGTRSKKVRSIFFLRYNNSRLKSILYRSIFNLGR